MSKTVRDVVEPGERVEFDGRTVMVLADDDPILDYPVIEPSGVVLAVDREKLEVAACNAFNLACDDAPVDGDMLWRRTVEAILTSLAEDGFREVEELRHIAVPEGQLDIVVPVLVSDEVFRTHGARGCRYVDIASLKPLPPAKGD